MVIPLHEKYQLISLNSLFVFTKKISPDVFSVDETLPEHSKLFPSKLNNSFEVPGETSQSIFPSQIIFNHPSL